MVKNNKNSIYIKSNVITIMKKIFEIIRKFFTAADAVETKVEKIVNESDLISDDAKRKSTMHLTRLMPLKKRQNKL